jgi:hypothetical protein
MIRSTRRLSLATGLVLGLAAQAAQAQSLLVDGFTSPTAPVPSVFLGTGERSITELVGDVPGGVRTAYHNVYLNPLPSVSVAVAGNGVLSVSDGVGATSELLSLYGAFATTVGVNVAPAIPGGAVTVTLPFAATPDFNFADVDGISLVLNRAIGPLTGNGYTLDSFSLVTAVPEPGSAVLMLGGALLLATRLRRRAGS